MIYSRKYSRNFIPLKQDSSKYTLDFRPSLGRCLIEIKDGLGKINIYAQGVKPKTDYRVELIGFEKGNLKNAYLGTFNVDEYGKGEFKNSFNPDNVSQTASKIEDFNVVSLIVDNVKEVHSALVGYVGNEVFWKDKYSTNAIINIPKEDNIGTKKPDNTKNIEEGLIEKEKGLIEREEGLIEKEKGLIEKEQGMENGKGSLEDFERALEEKERGLLEKEKGLAQKEQGLLEKEKALQNGNLPADDKCIREQEMELIRKEIKLIKKEQQLINMERELIRKNPTTDKEKGLIEKEKGLIEREQGLLEREKGLIEKEKGLFEIEKGMRKKENCIERDREKDNNNENNNNNNNKNNNNNENNNNENNNNNNKENNNDKEEKHKENEEKTNHQNFKNMLEKLKRDMEDIKDMSKITEKEVASTDNKDIEYIKFNNAGMTPFKDVDRNVTWYRISPYELTAFSENVWKYANNPYVFNCYKKYNHLMLGIDRENNKEKYILGVPCQYEENFTAKGELKQFKKFVPINADVSTNSIKHGEYGYRIINI